MAKIDAAIIAKIRLSEQGSTPSNPASTYQYLYVKTDGLYLVNSSGAVTGPMVGSLGSVTPTDGWVSDAAHTWTYASATSFTIAGVDLTAVFTKGTRLKWTQTTVKYGVVASSSFSTNTTVNLITTSDYSVANAAISANYYSYIANPQGYPTNFNWTPTLVGFSADPTNVVNQWSAIGNLITLQVAQATNGTSNATNFTFTLPVTALTVSNGSWVNACRAVDNGALLTGAAFILVVSAGTTASVLVNGAATAWTAGSTGKRLAQGAVTYPF